TRLSRRMRGGAQAHLLACEDGRHYVTKFLNNPQHRRILANEWAASLLLTHLGVAAPEARIIRVEAEFLAAHPEVHFQLGSRRVPVVPGIHFGSLFPGDPERDAVYDYLPDALLPSVVNLSHFAGALVFDKWTSNSDARQAIFFRRRIRDYLDQPATPNQKGFIAQMIDHGYIFDGPHWDYPDSPLQGLYFRPHVYQYIRSLDDFEPWLSRARNCPEQILDDVLRTTPRAWIDGEEEEWERLLERLYARRRKIEHLLLATVRARPQSFPSWGG
ncbi:MAG: HipA family kinase, partial [Bryobacteraceae bacterium]